MNFLTDELVNTTKKKLRTQCLRKQTGKPSLYFMVTSYSQYSSHSMCPGPFLRGLDRSGLVFLPPLSNIVGEWVIGVRGSKQGLDGQKDRADLEGGRPVV